MTDLKKRNGKEKQEIVKEVIKLKINKNRFQQKQQKMKNGVGREYKELEVLITRK